MPAIGLTWRAWAAQNGHMDAPDRLLYPFRYFDPIRNRWMKARYKARKDDIAARHAQWEVTGPGWRSEGGNGQFIPPTV